MQPTTACTTRISGSRRQFGIKYRPDSEGTTKRVAECRRRLHRDHLQTLTKYLDGRAQQFVGDYGSAARSFRELLVLDRSRPEPFLRLRECLTKTHESEKKTHELLREELAKAKHAPLVSLPPQQPNKLAVKFDRKGGCCFTAGSFQHVDPAVKHLTTTWEVREAEPASQNEFVLRMVSKSPHLTSFYLPAYRLRPNTTYSWRVFYQSSSGRLAGSDEVQFTSANYPQKAVHIELKEHFNRDSVLNRGDPNHSSVDGGGYSLAEIGFVVPSTGERISNGMPSDGTVGIHQMGDYDAENAIQINRRTVEPIVVAVPELRYENVRLLITGGWGTSVLPLDLEYTDGPPERYKIHCEDWERTLERGRANWAGTFIGQGVPILSNLEHVNIDGDIRGRGGTPGASLFEVSLEVNPQKVLQAIVLHADQLEVQGPRTHFNLFAITGVIRQ